MRHNKTNRSKKFGRRKFLAVTSVTVTGIGLAVFGGALLAGEAKAGWRKSGANPVLGGSLGTCFDVSVLKEENLYRMWFSWRPKQSIAYTESEDGVHWSEPIIALSPNKFTDWEEDLNRPSVIKQPDGYHMWYTGQARDQSWIGYARSSDGKTWNRSAQQPVLSPDQSWEKGAVMCPGVLWNEQTRLYQMWYSAGEQHEPNAIGYATSTDGLNWSKHPTNPIFLALPQNSWEKHKVTACQVIYYAGWYTMFYIGFADEQRAQIGLARSRDGITAWQRHSSNPILSPGFFNNPWDQAAVYKPSVVLEKERWLLWYNGRRGTVEQIGLAFHDGLDLGFTG